MTSVFNLPENHPLRAAHNKSIHNRAEIERSEKCGCFHCMKIFDAHQIADWVDTRGPHVQQTALCPYCGIDSVIGDNSGAKITERFLRKMRKAWF